MRHASALDVRLPDIVVALYPDGQIWGAELPSGQ